MEEYSGSFTAAPGPDAVWARYGSPAELRRLAILTGAFLVAPAVWVLVLVLIAVNDAYPMVDLIVFPTQIVAMLSGGAALYCGGKLVMLPFYKRNRPAVAVDGQGVWWLFKQQATVVSWGEIAGIGVCTKSWTKIPFLAGLATQYAFEVFVHEAAIGVYLQSPHMRRFLANQLPPQQGLPGSRFRQTIPMSDQHTALTEAIRMRAPQLWIGEYRRPWP
ncbi:MAG TPA: hypothetical protein VE172_24165 [Stackebrandtia sp.]|uniref:hypothetical protein n=1 Tax=Stackebrandtia sp. TaxID=2023065 RepID=UPI002D485950|nr:hypothetical protein [Stackebrandtia sp.]HZE41906.1 hypothetical protein [Stackebrandtia sp.]